MTSTKKIIEHYGLVEDIGIDSEIDLYRKRLKTIQKTLSLKDDEQVLLVSSWLLSSHPKDTTLKTLTVKSRSKHDYESDLSTLYELQYGYFEKELQQELYEEAIKTHFSMSDVDIKMKEDRYKYSIQLINDDEYDSRPLFDIEKLLGRIKEHNEQLNGYIDDTLVFLRDRSNVLSYTDFNTIVDVEMSYYEEIKKNYSYPYEQDKNPYLSAFHFIRRNYIHSYHTLDLPEESYFVGLHVRPISMTPKNSYSMKDLAVVLAQLSDESEVRDEDIQKAYDRLKKFFQKYSSFKRESYPDIYGPLAQYLFLRRKNTSMDDKDSKFIISRIESILRIVISGEIDKIDVIFKYTKFINEEFYRIIGVNSLAYQETMLNYWFHTIVNIYYRTLGLSSEIVYMERP